MIVFFFCFCYGLYLDIFFKCVNKDFCFCLGKLNEGCF